MCVPLWPLHKVFGIRKIVVSTYQSASGAGAKAMRELEEQCRDFAADKELKAEVFPYQIAFNVFSHNSAVEENGFNGEENKMVEETKKMFHEPGLEIVPMCVRVPVLRAHSESIYIETEKEISPDKARKLLREAPGVIVVDDVKKGYFPMPIEANGKLEVLVGRIRQTGSKKSLALFVAGDQLLKGAAWNAVQIAEELILS
jgi:aspartate-semialdehyde dehydrogenase